MEKIDALLILYIVLVCVCLKIAFTKIKTVTKWLWREVGKNYYHNVSIWNIKKSQQIYESSLKCSLGCSQVLSMAWPTVILATPGVCLEYLNLKWLHSYSRKKSLYLLIKTFIQIFSLIFLKISWRAAALHPLWMSCPW